MESVKHTVLVLSGKGGVGKSTVTANLAYGLATDEDTQVGKRPVGREKTTPKAFKFGSPCSPAPQVGVMDVDICGPSQPKLFGVEREQVHRSGSGWQPVVGLIRRDPAAVWNPQHAQR